MSSHPRAAPQGNAAVHSLGAAPARGPDTSTRGGVSRSPFSAPSEIPVPLHGSLPRPPRQPCWHHPASGARGTQSSSATSRSCSFQPRQLLRLPAQLCPWAWAGAAHPCQTPWGPVGNPGLVPGLEDTGHWGWRPLELLAPSSAPCSASPGRGRASPVWPSCSELPRCRQPCAVAALIGAGTAPGTSRPAPRAAGPAASSDDNAAPTQQTPPTTPCAWVLHRITQHRASPHWHGQSGPVHPASEPVRRDSLVRRPGPAPVTGT